MVTHPSHVFGLIYQQYSWYFNLYSTPMSISKLVLHLKGENRCDQSLPTETYFWYLSKIYWLPAASRYKCLSPAQTDVSHNPKTETFPPCAWVTANYPPFPTHNVFAHWLPAPCPLSLPQLNSLTFKLGANVFSPVKPYSTSQSKSTHILLYVFLPWSVCAPITQLDWEPWETSDHAHLSSCLLVLYPRKAGGNMPDDVNRQNNSEAWVEVALYYGLQTFCLRARW